MRAQAETLNGRMRAQTEAAVADADAILFLTDSRAGLMPADRHFASLVRRAGKPTILVANKAEGRAGLAGAYEAFDLGLGEPVALSAEHGEGLADLYAALARGAAGGDAVGHDEEDEARAPRQLRRGGRQRARPDQAGPHRRRRPAQCRQIDAAQRAARRGPPAHRPGARHHARLDRPRRSIGTAGALKIFDTAGLRKRARIDDKLEKLAAADALRGGQIRRSRDPAARRDDPVREAGSDDRRSSRARGPGAGHRPQQVGPDRDARRDAVASCARKPTGCCRRSRACRSSRSPASTAAASTS